MKSGHLVRFGVAIDAPLLGELDALVAERGCTRSELFRDLGRAEVARAKVPRGVDAVGALTLVYDHHVRDLSEKLTELQHQLGDDVRAAMHVHLSHDLCLEVIVIRGKSDRLKTIADRMLAMRGVKHGGVEIVADVLGRENLRPRARKSRRSPAPPKPAPAHAHEHEHEHAHAHAHDHAHPHAPARRSRTR